MPSTSPILVTGATGNNGRALLPLLLAAGVPVRAMVQPGHAARADLPAGVEIVEGDFDGPATLDAALRGVGRAFLVTNSTERTEARQLAFVEAARRAGVGHVVHLSQLHARVDSPVRFLRYHAVVERALEASGMTWTHLRPNLYMQGLLLLARTIAESGTLYAPIGDARVSLVDVRDIAAVAARALTEDGHAGRTYDLTGPDALTHGEIAAHLAAATGRPVTFVEVAPEAMRAAAVATGMPAWQADGLIEDYAHYARGEAAGLSAAIHDVTGQPPRTFAAFAREAAAAFGRPDRPAVG